MKANQPLLIFLIVLFGLLSKACQNKPDVVRQPPVKPAYELAIGEKLSFSLNTNHSLGLAWKWINRDSGQIVKLNEVTHHAHPGREDCIGCGGYANWTFEALKKGKFIIRIGEVMIGTDSIRSEQQIKITVK